MQTYSESGIQNNQSWVSFRMKISSIFVQCKSRVCSTLGDFCLKMHHYVYLFIVFLCRDPFMILSGGLSYDTVGRRACLTVMHGKSTAVLEMDYPIVDFLTLCETPYPNGNPPFYFFHNTLIQRGTLEKHLPKR